MENFSQIKSGSLFSSVLRGRQSSPEKTTIPSPAVITSGAVGLSPRRRDISTNSKGPFLSDIMASYSVGWNSFGDSSVWSDRSPTPSPRKDHFEILLEAACGLPDFPEIIIDDCTSSESKPAECYKYKEILGKQKKDSTLRLNFAYRRRYEAARNLSPRMTFSDSSFSSLSDDDIRMPTPWRVEPDFRKFIPVSTHASVMCVPKLEINKMDPKEWEEAQSAFLESIKTRVAASKSDFQLVYMPGRRRSRYGKLKKFFSCAFGISRSSAKENSSPGMYGVICDKLNSSILSDQEENLPNMRGMRFRNRLNLEFIKIAVSENPNFTAVLYAELPEEPNFELCHIQTELAVSAMLNFFHPWQDVQCLWINNLQKKVSDLLRDRSLKAKFTRLVYLRRFEAVLVVSEDSGILLRHKDLCFLQSLADALCINCNKLLVLVKNPQAQQIHLTGPESCAISMNIE